MGFDVIYFPPIHPIGHTNRKGRNNSTACEPGDPGVPWAIGSEAGGHKAVEPSLGTLEDFDWLQERGAQARNGNRARFRDQLLARSSARQRASRIGSTNARTARSNTPRIRRKRYEDIYPLNFRCENWRELWAETEKRRAVLGRARRAHLPRGQSAHQTSRFLGIFDQRASARNIPTRFFSPKRSPGPR